MSLKSYYAVASYKDKKGSFSFNEGDVIQVLQKDPSGKLNKFYITMYYMKSMWRDSVLPQYRGICAWSKYKDSLTVCDYTP